MPLSGVPPSPSPMDASTSSPRSSSAGSGSGSRPGSSPAPAHAYSLDLTPRSAGRLHAVGLARDDSNSPQELDLTHPGSSKIRHGNGHIGGASASAAVLDDSPRLEIRLKEEYGEVSEGRHSLAIDSKLKTASLDQCECVSYFPFVKTKL